MSSPTAAVLLIGNELLSGRTADANLNYIARRMTDIGIKLKECRVIRDDVDTIAEHVNTLRKTHTYVFTTGGIGPTHDDITMESIAKAFGVEIERHDEVVEAFTQHYAALNKPTTAATFKMADFPVGAELIHNSATHAPGAKMENVYIFAGIPKIMQAMLEAVIPTLTQGDTIYTHSIDAFISESQAANALEDVQNQFPKLDIGSYPFKEGDRFGTSLVTRGTNQKAVDQSFSAIKSFLDSFGAEVRG